MLASRSLYVFLGTVILLSVLLVSTGQHEKTVRSFSSLANSGILGSKAVDEIPNIVHFIFYTQPGKEAIEMNLLGFLAMYSAAYHMPDAQIYLHTNGTDEMIERMRNPQVRLEPPRFPDVPTTIEDHPAHVDALTDPEYLEYWTQALVRGIPNLKIIPIRKEYSPTPSGKHLEKLAHWNDFARGEILYETGGTVLDLDAIVIRDLKPLRQAGFRTVMAKDTEVQCAVLMATPGSATMKAYRDLMDASFTPGNYYFHCTSNLHEIKRTTAQLPNEMLMMSDAAFYPAALHDRMGASLWELRSEDMTSASHAFEAKKPESSPFDVDSYIANFRVKAVNEHWGNLAGDFGLDLSETYVIHGVHSAFRDGILNDRILDHSGTTPSRLRHGLTIPLILQANNNFARATLPIVKHALAQGVISL